MLSKEELADLAPLVRRAASLDGSGVVRLRRSRDRISAFVRLPFGVLVARTIALDDPDESDPDESDLAESDPDESHRPVSLDVTVASKHLLAWLDDERSDPPEPRDSQWRGSVPPTAGWQRVDTVPDAEVRPLVHSGALALREAAEREGVRGAEPRADVADALLDSVVLTVADGTHTVEVVLRTLSAVIRLGFLPDGSYLAVDVAGPWVRVAAAYGSVYAERAAASLRLAPR